MDGFRTLKQGCRVSYELTQGPKGDLAQNIRLVDEPVDAVADRRPAHRPEPSVSRR
jgi:CspA family cold shock protein